MNYKYLRFLPFYLEFAKMLKSEGGGVGKFSSLFLWGTKSFCLHFMGYEIFLGILEFDSAPVLGIKTGRSLIRTFTNLFYQVRLSFITILLLLTMTLNEGAL